MPCSMDAVAWFLQIPQNPRRTSSTGTVSMLSSRLLRGSARSSQPHDTPPRSPPRSVTWSSHVEVWRQPSRCVTWSTQVEVFIIPARERAADDWEPYLKSTARECAPKDCVKAEGPSRTCNENKEEEDCDLQTSPSTPTSPSSPPQKKKTHCVRVCECV